jgi:4-amino-4-deoxy-L-arabinose transferase-like glycosyltransferase
VRLEAPIELGKGIDLAWLRRAALPVFISSLLIGALLLRLPGITTPSIEQRETQSALLAREWYMGDGGRLPAWQQDVLRELRGSVKPIEPPVTDFLTSVEFRLSGENFWFPRLLSSFYWVLGGLFLYLIGKRVAVREGALVALALYLTWPFAVRHSRLFMPDALMVCFLLAAALTVLRYWERPSVRRLIAAGAVSSLATAVKPGVTSFYLIALFAALAVSHRKLCKAVLEGKFPLYVVLTATVAGAYYVYGTRLSDFIWFGAAPSRITPGLVLHGEFWGAWWRAVSYLLSFPQRQTFLAVVPIAAGLAGILVATRRHARATLLGLLFGYLAFALTVAYYTSGNPYYSLPLIPILALSIGVLVGFVLERAGLRVRVAVLALAVAVTGVAAYKSAVILRVGDPRQRIADYRRIGELTGHTTRALVVNDQLRTPVMYWGWIVGENWELTDAKPPPWTNPEKAEFLIVVGTGPLETHHGLRDFSRDLPVVARTSRYAVFDLRGRNRAAG